MLGALIAGGASLLGGFQQQYASAKQAGLQQAYQERMSNTAHQREVDDLRKAGLNPILSGTGGHGSTTPPGASGQMSDAITPAVSSFREKQLADSSIKLQAEQARLATASADKESEVASIYKTVVPLIRDGISGVQSTAKSAGEGIARIEEAIKKALSQIPNIAKMPAAEIIKDVGEKLRDIIPGAGVVKNLAERVRSVLKEKPATRETINPGQPDYLRVPPARGTFNKKGGGYRSSQ